MNKKIRYVFIARFFYTVPVLYQTSSDTGNSLTVDCIGDIFYRHKRNEQLLGYQIHEEDRPIQSEDLICHFSNFIQR